MYKTINAKLNETWWFDLKIVGCQRTLKWTYHRSRSGKFSYVDIVEQTSAQVAQPVGRLISLGDDVWEFRPAWQREGWETVIEKIALNFEKTRLAESATKKRVYSEIY